ncbi:uncharacterized protein LOC142233289 [Haematobia irritans]|uniref:uncharacterized protein LOC142225169 n=1 Tax=Haematobia irritans TaxID=7368 RepID=UPI003F50CEFE
MTIYTNIKNKYNHHTYNAAKRYSKTLKQTANLKSSVTFLIKCKRAVELLTQEDLNLYLDSERILYKSRAQKNKATHIKKLQVLKQQQNKQLNIKTNNDWFVNKTEKDIPREVQWILSLGPKHALPHTNTQFPLLQAIAEGEDCIQTIESRERQEMARTKLTTLIDDHLRKPKLSMRDRYTANTVVQTRKYLKDNDDILILTSDKGGKTVAMDKMEYNLKMKEIVHDMCTYKRLKVDPTSRLQTKNNKLVDKLFNLNIISMQEKNKLTSRTAIAPRIYGLPKIHKEGTPLRPICSSVNSPSYNLCKYIVNILKNITEDSKYNVKDSIAFKSKVNDMPIQDDEVLISFDVVSLFPSIPINLAIQTIERKWTKIEQYTGIPKDIFKDLIIFCIKDTRYFKFEDRVYEQLKGMPMGSPASPIIADIIMEELLDDVFKKTTKPRVVTKYVDDIFAIIKRSDVEETLNALNSYNRQIQFTKEEELDQKLPYLDTIVHRQGNQLKLNWYQKPTASGRLLNFYSNHNKRIIINTATNFIIRVLSISDPGFHLENEEKIRKILTNNDFPKRTIQNLINKVKSKQMNNKNENNEKVMKIYKPVTYIAGFSERLCKSDIYDKDKYQLALKTTKTVKGLFSKTKTKIKNDDKSNIIYKIKCKGDKSNLCQKTYIGTTMTKLKTRLSSHKSDIKATDKPMEQKTALAAHCAQTGHKPNFEGVEILDHENNYRRRFTLEMLHIINTPPDERMNYKKDIENCARIYRHTIQKHNRKLNSV